MKIILVQHVSKLGNPGDILEVAPGYGRDFLIAKGFVREATRDVVVRVQAVKQKKSRKQEQVKKVRNELHNVLSGQVILIRASANEEGNLFGGIGPKEIVEAIEKRKKIQVDPKAVNLPHHLKTLGKHEVVLSLGGSDSITITINIARNE